MNIFSTAGRWVVDKAKQTGRAVEKIAREQFKGELARVRQAASDTVRGIRTSITEGADDARSAAADAIAKGAAGAGIKTAARVGPRGNVYERALPFLDMSPEQRSLVMLAIGVLVAIFLLRGKR